MHAFHRLLIQLVEQYGVRKWSLIAQMLPGRIGKQCRERWHNHLRPDIKVRIVFTLTFVNFLSEFHDEHINIYSIRDEIVSSF